MAITINHQTNDISASSGSLTIDGASAGGSSFTTETTTFSGNLGGSGSPAIFEKTGLNAPDEIRLFLFFDHDGTNPSATNGVSVQLGTASGYETSGYHGAMIDDSNGTNFNSYTSLSIGEIVGGFSNYDTYIAARIIKAASNRYYAESDYASRSPTSAATFDYGGLVGGHKNLSGALTKLKIFFSSTAIVSIGHVIIQYK
jgi:hypothetical protein